VARSANLIIRRPLRMGDIVLSRAGGRTQKDRDGNEGETGIQENREEDKKIENSERQVRGMGRGRTAPLYH